MLQISAFVLFIAVVVAASLMFLPATFIYGLPFIVVGLAIVALLTYAGVWRDRAAASREHRDANDTSGQGVSHSPDNR